MNRLKKFWCNNFHIWESTSARFDGKKEHVLLAQACDTCKRIYLTSEGVLFFSRYAEGQKFLSEEIYSVLT